VRGKSLSPQQINPSDNDDLPLACGGAFFLGRRRLAQQRFCARTTTSIIMTSLVAKASLGLASVMRTVGYGRLFWWCFFSIFANTPTNAPFSDPTMALSPFLYIYIFSTALDKMGKSIEVTKYTERLVPSTRFVAYNGVAPIVSEQSFVAPSASVIGNVTIGKESRYVDDYYLMY
jgi:hypothetical protein